MDSTKIIAMYLPQFHTIPENSRFWGEGFTDWITVKKAKPLFTGHNEPRKPQNNNYYDLSKKEVLKDQVDKARKFGIYGFCFYHYWFSSKKNILTKPSEMFLHDETLNLNFCFAWDNASWVRSWSNITGNDWAPIAENKRVNEDKVYENGVMIQHVLGNEKDWEIHYSYLREFFKDSRYIKVNNKPMFVVWNYNKDINRMEGYWNKLAQQDGFDGIEFIYRAKPHCNIPHSKNLFFYEPAHAAWENISFRLKNKIISYVKKKRIKKFDYNKVWNNILYNARNEKNDNVYFGAFVDYDDTPRRGDNGQLMINVNSEIFKRNLQELAIINTNRAAEYIFLTAWNEWGEGAYLEEDVKNGDKYLQAVYDVVNNI